jgi:rhomboid protease GluP
MQKATSVSGRNNETLNFSLYITLPIFVDAKDTLKNESSYWLGKQYSKNISNRLSDKEKEKEYERFVNAAKMSLTKLSLEGLHTLTKWVIQKSMMSSTKR